MRLIAMLSERIDEELEDAEFYTKKAAELKLEHPDVAQLMDKLSGEEMGHMRQLHECAVKQIDAYRKEHGEPPVGMMAVYEYEHKKQMHKAALIRAMQEAYKG